MSLRRPTRYLGALLALVSMLFMQLAVAGYVCPGTSIGPGGHAFSQPAMQGMAGCDGMDMQQPALCHAYAQDGKQTLDKPDFPAVQPFIPGALSLVVQAVVDQSHPVSIEPAGDLLARATAPPLSIQHCCFRI
ncbi:hypothetical protein [Undibacterium terreum]|uniref:Uncharacterized protein n=1 Tax=Undibacterium terreum TaxID=1224302 RepID=A0A916XEH8_9BURK|nr:hypothetical protein [Undibacterium terreum]GGC64539.1 hypothetical protein GCM10011396_09410 [Undibacterium terreum]